MGSHLISMGMNVSEPIELRLKPEVSFVVPCLNEESNIQATVNTILSAVGEITFEIIVIDDGSTDCTAAIAQEISSKHPEYHLRVLKNEKNIGLGASYFKGSTFAKGKYYLLVMGDNVSPPESIHKVLSLRGKADIVIPFIGKPDRRPWFRRVLSACFTWVVRTFSGHPVTYFNGSSILQLTKNVCNFRSNSSGFAYQADLLCRLLDEGATYIEVSVDYATRAGGSTNAFKLKNIVSVSATLLNILVRRLRRICCRVSLETKSERKNLPEGASDSLIN